MRVRTSIRELHLVLESFCTYHLWRFRINLLLHHHLHHLLHHLLPHHLQNLLPNHRQSQLWNQLRDDHDHLQMQEQFRYYK